VIQVRGAVLTLSVAWPAAECGRYLRGRNINEGRDQFHLVRGLFPKRDGVGKKNNNNNNADRVEAGPYRVSGHGPQQSAGAT